MAEEHVEQSARPDRVKDILKPFVDRLNSEATTSEERTIISQELFNLGSKIMAETIGHEGGNALSSAKAYLEIVRDDATLPEEEKIRLLGKVSNSVERVGDLLDRVIKITHPKVINWGEKDIVYIDKSPIDHDDDGL